MSQTPLLVLPLLLIVAGTLAAQPTVDALTPESAVAIALAQNRDLQAARFAIREAEGRLQQAGLWPNPELELGAAPDTLFANEGEYSLSAGFKQRFPIAGRLTKARAVARVDVAQAVAEVRNQERLLAGEVLGRSREWLILQKKLEANQEFQDTLQSLIAVSENRLKVAEVSATDVNLAKLALQTVALARATLLNQQEIARAQLNRLLGREADTTLRLTGDINPDIDLASVASATATAVSRRPDHQLAVLATDRAAAEISLARAEKWQDWTAGLDYSRDYQKFTAPIGGKLDQFLGVSVSISLPLRNQNQGNIAAAQASRDRRQAELEGLDLRISTEAQSARNQMIRLLEVLRQYRETSLKLAGENVAALQKSYGEGLVAITAVIQAQQQMIDLRQNYLDTLDAFARAWTDWQTATGILPSGPTQP